MVMNCESRLPFSKTPAQNLFGEREAESLERTCRRGRECRYRGSRLVPTEVLEARALADTADRTAALNSAPTATGPLRAPPDSLRVDWKEPNPLWSRSV